MKEIRKLAPLVGKKEIYTPEIRLQTHQPNLITSVHGSWLTLSATAWRFHCTSLGWQYLVVCFLHRSCGQYQLLYQVTVQLFLCVHFDKHYEGESFHHCLQLKHCSCLSPVTSGHSWTQDKNWKRNMQYLVMFILLLLFLVLQSTSFLTKHNFKHSGGEPDKQNYVGDHTC